MISALGFVDYKQRTVFLTASFGTLLSDCNPLTAPTFLLCQISQISPTDENTGFLDL